MSTTNKTIESEASNPQLGESERVRQSIENWKRKLLDLSKRNRALHFRMNKVSTIAIVHEQPAEVFRTLYLQERAMRFKAAAEEAEEQLELISDDADVRELTGGNHQLLTKEGNEVNVEAEDQNDNPGLDFVPYDPASLERKYSDDWLQTSSKPEMLDKSLRRLDEQARLTIEEQGVNTLFLSLGMLHYTESTDSKEVFKAPVILLPVQLTRASARSGFQLRATGEDAMTNPALVEFLRLNYGMSLPELPDAHSMPEDYDLQSIFSSISTVIRGRQDWSLKTDVYLGLFSFQKLVMYKDLEANAEQFSGHKVIRQIVLRSGDQIVGLPEEIRKMQLDEEFPPESTYQVVDADSSQLKAIAACARNYDLVIEGPPGTGKSQTITNLIAQALAVGKSVLFVAEKMAALEVVHNRLVQAGLGESCLELHSTKANKRTVMSEIARALDASLQGIAAPTASTQRIPQVRSTLSEYVNAVHTPFGLLGISPYRAYGNLGDVIKAPRLNYAGAADAVTLDQLEQTVRDLNDLAATSVPIGLPSVHPWRDATRTYYSEQDLHEIGNCASSLEKELTQVIELSKSVEEAFGIPTIRGMADIDSAIEIAEVLKRSPGAPLAVLESEVWNTAPIEATSLVRQGRELSALKQRAADCFTEEVLLIDHADDIAYIERKSEGFLSLLAFLDGRYRAIKRKWIGFRLPSYKRKLIDQAGELKHVDRLRELRSVIEQARPSGKSLFGDLWQGEDTTWDSLDTYIRWVVEMRALCVTFCLKSRALEVASNREPNVSQIEQLKDIGGQVSATLGILRRQVGWPDDYLSSTPLSEIALRAYELRASLHLGPQWAAFESARQIVEQGLARDVVPYLLSGELAFRDVAAVFLRAFYMKWLATVVQDRPSLARFNTLTHEQRIAEFKELDQRVLLENRAALVSQLRDRVQHQLQQSDVAGCLPHLRREIARQRRHAPLRRTMKEAGGAIRVIKPCFMMSPLTVAQLLDAYSPSFDLVIFDEASQLPPEDAVGAIARGKQLVVVGDPKQLPPTNFFQVTNGQINVELDDDGIPIYEDSESILENFMGAGAPMSRLKWHYRSTHESLINFSNVSFYDKDLYTFPSVEIGNDRSGLQFEYVPDGVYEGKGLNQSEARRVADAVVSFAKEQLKRRESGEEMRSLAVGTFNLRQQVAIQDELEVRRREDSEIEPFFSREMIEPFFVKNLENIQGDERDVIYISVTYAKGPDGKLRYNFGPLNKENGRRRLNVLITRARQRMRIFSSMKGDEINPVAISSEGPRLLREFLLYAEKGRLDSSIASLTANTDSPFETDVLTELTRKGLNVVPQVGAAGYRIDLGVLDDISPGRFLCGIECDGVAYHNSETARDRDRLRQQVLEARGWTIFRVWSTDWFKDRQGQIDRLMSLIKGARIRAIDEGHSGAEARERVKKDEDRTVTEDSGLPKDSEQAGRVNDDSTTPYKRPVAEPYETAPGEGRYARHQLLDATTGQIVRALVTVVEVESPVHLLDLAGRVAGMWGQRLGPRIQQRILDACGVAEATKAIQRRGDFFWRTEAKGKCKIRNRAGTGIPANRIAPEELREAIRRVLMSGHTLSRHLLVNEVRSVFGFNRTGAILDEAINREIDAMLVDGKVGEGSIGIRLRA
jgi:very-short-patch-repair endonuclease